MSIAEFYIENGIDPSDPNHMDDFLERFRNSDDNNYDEPVTGLAIVQERVERDFSSRSAASSWPLNESELDYLAETRGWEKVEGFPAQTPMASYRRDSVRLNFWLSTGTVGSYLDHPRQGKTQLFRRDISMSGARDVFDNPRTHTGGGYHRREEQSRRQRNCRYGTSCTRRGCRFNHPNGSSAGGGGSGGGRGPCRYGEGCTRPDCWFDHP